MPVDGLAAYKKPLSGEEKKRFDETWDNIFRGKNYYEKVKAKNTKDTSGR